MFGNKKTQELISKINSSLQAGEPMKIEFSGDQNLEQIAQAFNKLISMNQKFSKENEFNKELIEKYKDSESKLGEIELAISQMGAVSEMGKKVASVLDREQLFQEVYKVVSSNFQITEMEIVISTKEGGEWEILSLDETGISHFGILDQFNQKSRFQWVFDQHNEVVLNEVSADYGQYFFDPVITAKGNKPESYFAYPLGSKEKQIGIMAVSVAQSNAFNTYELDILRSISAYIALAVDNASMYARIQENLQIIQMEKKKSDELLLNILPEEVASELKLNGFAEAKYFEEVTVLFTDFVGFTRISETLSPKELVSEIDSYFSQFDRIMATHGIEKIKTIGDAYMAVCGLPSLNEEHAIRIINAAKDIVAFVKERKDNGGAFDIRVGINTGSVVAGIIGIRKYAYDIWGDTVNTAARMESNSESGKINISESTFNLVKDQIACTYRGEIEAKNKGLIKMYFVD